MGIGNLAIKSLTTAFSKTTPNSVIAALPRTTREMLISRSKTLYHYTSPEALISILASGQLWSSNIRFLNDAQEVGYADELVRKVTLAKRKKLARSPAKSKFLDSVLRRWEDQALDEVYACCFCEEGDLLSQWRSYSRQGRGFAIGFDRRHVDTIADGERFRLMKMIYKELHQKRIIETVLDRYCEVVAGMKTTFIDWSSFCVLQLRGFTTAFKHPAFEGENEVRLVFSEPPEQAEKVIKQMESQQKGAALRKKDGSPEERPVEIKFRQHAEFFVPYIELPFRDPGSAKPSRAITEIKIGPTIDAELAKASLDYVRRHYRYAGVSVRPSDVPFRG